MTQDQVIAGETKVTSRADAPDREAATPDVPAFAFGKNWQRFLELFSAQRGRTAADSIRDFTGLPDVTDWVGGYPYEFATVQEVFDFVRQAFPEFLLEELKSTRGLGTNWFLFRRVG